MKKSMALLFLLPTALLADEVFLKGAGKITGRIVEQTETTVMVDIGAGVMGVPMSRVDRIVKGRTPLDEYEDRAGRTGPQDIVGWRELAQWAAHQGLSKQSREAWDNVRAMAPDDAEANAALGLVLLDGRWVTEEEGYRARGYVKYEGEWMTPEEARMHEEHAAAEQERYEAEKRAIEEENLRFQEETEAAKEAERAAEEQARANEYSIYNPYYPVYWGGWGYGVTTWPVAPVNRPARPIDRPVNPPARPANPPARVPR